MYKTVKLPLGFILELMGDAQIECTLSLSTAYGLTLTLFGYGVGLYRPSELF